MKAFFRSIPPLFKNFYFLASILFLVWMLFFDSNDLITQSSLGSKKAELEQAKEFYEDKIVEAEKDRQALITDEDLLEKIAREKYLMKKKSEDLYIVVEE